MVARLHARGGLGPHMGDDRRLRGRRRAPGAAHHAGPGGSSPAMYDPVWLPDGASLLVRDDVVPLDGSTPRKLPWAGEHGGGRVLA